MNLRFPLARLAFAALAPIIPLSAGESQLTADYTTGLDIFGTGNGVNFIGNGKISGGTSHAADQSTYFLLSTANSITGGTQTMMGLYSFLRTNAASSLVGGTQNFTGQQSYLLASATNGITGGTQNFSGTYTSLKANSYQGVNGGTQVFTGTGAVLIAEAAGAINGGHQHFYSGTTFQAKNAGVVTGGTAHLYSGGLYDIWTANATTAGASVIFENGGTIDLDASSTLGHISSANTGAGSISSSAGATLNVQFDTSALTFSGVASGNLGLVKSGSGNWTLSGLNTHTGGTTVNGGTLTLATGGQTGTLRGALTINAGGTVVTSAKNALGWGTGTKIDALTLNGGTLNHTGVGSHGLGIAYTLNDGATMSSNGGVSSTTAESHFSIDGGSSVTAYGTAPSTIAGRVDLRGDGGFSDVTFTVFHGARLNVTAGISSHSGATLEGPVGIVKADLGTLALTGNNTYTGNTTVNGGLVEFNSATALGATSNKVILNGGGLRWASGTTTDISGRLDALGASGGTVDTNGNNVAFATALSGTGALTKTGSGKLTLSTVNTHSGGTVVNGGTLELGGADGTGPGLIRGNLTINSGATLRSAASNTFGWSDGVKVNAVTINGGTLEHAGTTDLGWGIAYTLNGGTMSSNGGTSNSTATSKFAFGGAAGANSSLNVTGTTTSTIAGRLNLRADNANTNVDITVDTAATLNVTAAITGGATVGLTKKGAGILTLAGTNTYAGLTTVNAGLVEITNASSLGNGSGTNKLTLNGGGIRWGAAAGGDISARLNALGASGATFNTNGHSIAFATGLSGTGGLTKSGTGTLTLNGDSNYSGATAVDAGSLLVNGSLGHTALSVAAGATLGGSGTLGGQTTINRGAILAPGNSPGTLTFTHGLTLNSGAILDFELGSTSDLIRVSGGTLAGPSSGTVTLNLTDAGGFAAATYVLFNFADATLSDFSAADFDLETDITGYDFHFNLTASSLELIATTASAIPEPSAYAAAFGALAGFVALLRRRRTARV